MASVTGTLFDFGLEPMEGFAPKLIFRASTPGVSGMAVLATKAVEVTPAANGYFQVDLAPTAEVSPPMHYTIQLRWVETYPGRKERIETLPWKLEVPAAGGFLSDLLRVPSNPALAWSGEEPPANPTPGSWWLTPSTGELAEYDGTGWANKANLRGPAGYNATGAAGDDAAIAEFIKSPVGTTATRAALAERFSLKAEQSGRLPLLANITKAKTGVFRIFHMGTSIGDAQTAAGKLLAGQLQTLYGSAGMVENRAGILGGSYENAVNGWKKQPYGGPMFTRARGESTSTPLVYTQYFDTLTVEWSQESNAAPAEVSIDGAVVGSFGAAGVQKYSNRATFAAPLGWHTVSIAPPATGYAYLETLEFKDSTRTGVELRNAALGGSSIFQMETLRTPVGAQVAGIAINPKAGIDSFIDRPEVDLFSVSYVVNDAGAGEVWANGGYRTAMDYMVSKTAERGTPMLILIEMGGHYSMPNDGGGTSYNKAFTAIRDYLLGLRKHNHVTVVDWHAATILPDFATYAARYYTTVANLNVAAGTYTGDFIHPNTAGHQVAQTMVTAAAGIPPAPHPDPARLRWDRFRTLEPGTGMDKTATVAGAAKRYPMPSGPAMDPISIAEARRTAYYRDATAVNSGGAISVNTEIAASATSDKHGKYVDYTNKNIGLGFTPDFAAGKRSRYTFKVAPKAEDGSIDIRMGGSAKVFVDGQPITGNVLFQNIKGTAPVVVSVDVGAAAASQYISITGRVYEVAGIESTVPLFN